MARQFRASPTEDYISWGDITVLDSLTAISASMWVKVASERGYNQSFIRKDGCFTPAQTEGTNMRGILWIDGSTKFVGFGAYTEDTWQHYVITWESGDYVRGYKDGSLVHTSGATESGAVSNSGNGLEMGRAEWGGEFCDGDIAEIAFWNRELTSGEVTTLSGGVPATDVSSGLIFYAPLIGDTSPEPDTVGSEEGTITGSPQSTHPFVYPSGIASLRQLIGHGRGSRG